MGNVENIENFIDNPRKLDVFQNAYSSSLKIHKLSIALPKAEQYDLASQLRSSSKSICANIVEGFAKQSEYPQEFKRFLTIAIGSCEETQLWLQYCLDLGYISPENYNELNNEYVIVMKMLRSLRNKVKA
jgi:four helix bundle protein